MNKIIFLGQKPLGEKCFDILLKLQTANFSVIGVVSNKSKNVWWKSNRIYKRILGTSIKFIDNDKPNEKKIYDLIIDNNINTIISVQHSWILSNKILNSVSGFAFNLHNAKLPDYKGNNIFSHIILNGEKSHTSTIHFMSKEVDMGDIIIEKATEIDSKETSKSLYKKANENALNTFKIFIKSLKNQKVFEKTPIKHSGMFYNRNSLNGLKEIHNIQDFNEVDRKSRAFFFEPFEPAFYRIRGKKFYILPECYFDS